MLKRIDKAFILAIIPIILCLILKAMFTWGSETSLYSRSIKLVSPRGSCSGEQIETDNGNTYVLTAGHCNVLEQNGFIEAIGEDKLRTKLAVIAEDPNSDLLLLQAMPNIKGLKIAKSVSLDEHVRTFTHGHGFRTYRTEGNFIQITSIKIGMFPILSPEDRVACDKYPKTKIMQDWIFEVCVMSVDEQAGTAFTAPGSSGGMVVNDSDELVGVVSAGGDGFFYYVTLSDIRSFLREL